MRYCVCVLNIYFYNMNYVTHVFIYVFAMQMSTMKKFNKYTMLKKCIFYKMHIYETI